VPDNPTARQEWERAAALIGAYRETYGYEYPDDPIGPEPCREAPEQRAAWYEAFLALGPVDGPDVRNMPDGRLWLLRDAYAAETVWAPRHVGKELRLSRLGAFDADLGAIRAEAEADAARKTGDHDRARRHETLAASYRALRDLYQQREQTFAQTIDDRQKWEHATAHSRPWPSPPTQNYAVATRPEDRAHALRRTIPGQRHRTRAANCTAGIYPAVSSSARAGAMISMVGKYVRYRRTSRVSNR